MYVCKSKHEGSRAKYPKEKTTLYVVPINAEENPKEWPRSTLDGIR